MQQELITVCDKCHRASCWHGIWLCDEAQNAGTVDKPKDKLLKLKLEHPEYLRND